MVLGLAACASETVEPVSEDELSKACTATLTIWQKDAYKDLGGPLTPGWPPHSTTSLKVDCKGAPSQSAAMLNHSDVAVGQKDANGTPILTQVATETLQGSAAEMSKLLAAYKTAECSASTFFSLGKLDKGPAKDMFNTIRAAVEQDVKCTGTGKQELLTALSAADSAKATAAWKKCTLPLDKAQSAFEKGLLAAEQASHVDLAGYHVCNNDAMMQTKLMRDFRSTRKIPTADAMTALCKGPAFFYDPKVQ